MKKITVFSFFNSSNIGDLLIAQCATDFFSGVYDCSFCDISGEVVDVEQWRVRECEVKKEQNTTERFDKLKKVLLNNILSRSVISFFNANWSTIPQTVLRNTQNSDSVVFFGGNLVMELYKLPTSILVLYRSIASIKKRGGRVFLCAVGVGPFQNKCARKLASRILTLVDGVSVRDDASYALAKELAPKQDIVILRDPVLTVEREHSHSEKKNAIGVNVYFGPEHKYSAKMRAAFSKALSYLREKYPEYTVYLFSSEKLDISDCMAVKAMFQDDSQVIVKQIATADDLFQMHDQVDFVIGTRMHTIITALVSSKPVLAVSWQRKVTSLMEYFENEKWNISMSEFIKRPATFQAGIDSLIQSEQEIIQRNQKKIAAIKDTYHEQIEQLIERA